MNNVYCTGDETRIQDCAFSYGACSTGKVAGAECFDDPGLYGTTFAPECDDMSTTEGTSPTFTTATTTTNEGGNEGGNVMFDQIVA